MFASSAGRSSRSVSVRRAGIDRRQPPRESAESPDLSVNRLTAQVLEQVVVQVDAVERGVGWMGFVEIREVLVDEVRKGFG